MKFLHWQYFLKFSDIFLWHFGISRSRFVDHKNPIFQKNLTFLNVTRSFVNCSYPFVFRFKKYLRSFAKNLCMSSVDPWTNHWWYFHYRMFPSTFRWCPNSSIRKYEQFKKSFRFGFFNFLRIDDRKMDSILW